MNIGIISINMYSKGLNFACPLHSYAFQQFLKQNGYDSTILDYKPNYYEKDFDLRHPADFYAIRCQNFKETGRDQTEPERYAQIVALRDSWKALYQERETRYDKFQHFIETHYKKTDVCYDSDLLEFMDPGFDCYICCTDVIWRKSSRFGYDRGFFLASSAMENKWKIAYAASAGVFLPEEPKDREQFIHYVDSIDAISVREESLAEYLRPKIAQEVSVVLDPVLLQEREFYEDLLVKPQEQHYLFLYYVMEKAEATIEQAVKYARAHDLTIVEVSEQPEPMGRLKKYGGEDIHCIYDYGMGIEEWLGYIRYADVVFTNSFHCCCFSILFEKQFFAGYRTGDKVANLLNIFHLSGHMFNRQDDLIKNPLPEIDYVHVRPILQHKRKESADFILNALRQMEGRTPPKRNEEWWKRQQRYPISYNSGSFQYDYIEGIQSGKRRELSSGTMELEPEELMTNNGLFFLPDRYFYTQKYRIQIGWKIRFRIGQRWLWCMEDDSFQLGTESFPEQESVPIHLFRAGERINYLPFSGICRMVAVACWEDKEGIKGNCILIYNSGAKSPNMQAHFDESEGKIRKLETGSVEYQLYRPVENSGNWPTVANGFSYPGNVFTGWRLRAKIEGNWYWLLADHTLVEKSAYDPQRDGPRLILANEGILPYIPKNGVRTVVLEAEWETLKKMEDEKSKKQEKKKGRFFRHFSKS